MRIGLSPASIVYLLVHALSIAVGVIMMSFAPTREIGVGIVGAGVVGYVVFVYVRLSEDRAQRFQLLDKFGFVTAFETRSAAIRKEYETRALAAREQIDILGFGLRALREDFASQFSDWARRAQVRVLLLDPDFPSCAPYADQRDSEEKNNFGQIRGDALAFVEQVRSAFGGQIPSTFEVRYYRALPSINVFRVDNEAFWGPYLIGSQSRNTPTFIVRRGGVLYDRVVDHFETLWNDPNLTRRIE